MSAPVPLRAQGEAVSEETALVPLSPPAGESLGLPPEIQEAADTFAAAAIAKRTREIYRKALERFVAWCEAHRLPYLPASADTVAGYLTWRATEGKKPSTVALDLAALRAAYREMGERSPCEAPRVRAVWRGIRRDLLVAPVEKAPVAVEEMKAILARIPETRQGKRDRALVLVGFTGAFRRSELLSLDVEDLTWTPAGLEVRLRRSKTDQEGVGEKIGLPAGPSPDMCPAAALRAWLDETRISEGALFRSMSRGGRLKGRLTGQGFALVVKRLAASAGLDPRLYSGHSLRAGLITSAARAGRSEVAIMRQSRHRSVATLRKYVREADVFSHNAALDLLK